MLKGIRIIRYIVIKIVWISKEISSACKDIRSTNIRLTGAALFFGSFNFKTSLRLLTQIPCPAIIAADLADSWGFLSPLPLSDIYTYGSK